MINLFEYQNKAPFKDSGNHLEGFLDEIWRNREKSPFYYPETDEDKIEEQRFIQFIRSSNEIKSNKYVGVIQFGKQKINLLPKIFYEAGVKKTETEINHFHNHILWWLSYCRKIKFPNYQTSLGDLKNDFFEVLIYLFAKYTRELLNSSIYRQYEEVEKELSFIKGRLNINEYIKENLGKGRWHKLNCTYDAFVMDNEFNRIIKYVTSLLFSASSNLDNKKYLREILFLLDDVNDEPATAQQCAKIEFNPIFEEFTTVRDYCHLFLSNSISFNYKNDLKLFAFLLPMEYVFEDFIFGFIEKELNGIKASSQKSSAYLDEERLFNLKPDLYIETENKQLIADTKYKIVYSDEKDPKKGISQSDLYQMTAYAIRFKIDEIILFYPNTIKGYQNNSMSLSVIDKLADNKKILIKAYQLPIINYGLFEWQFDSKRSLVELFQTTREQLKSKLTEIFKAEEII